jgi:hypothetical protein
MKDKTKIQIKARDIFHLNLPLIFWEIAQGLIKDCDHGGYILQKAIVHCCIQPGKNL